MSNIPTKDLLELAKAYGAVYICPKDASGRRLGPLVAYAGKDGQGRNLVGDIYFNFLQIALYPDLVGVFAEIVCRKLHLQEFTSQFDTICGIPRGGKIFGEEVARILKKRFIFPEKKPKATEAGKKQEYTWDLSEFELEPGERIAIAEDVFNNFQNTDNTLAEVEATGANVVLLVGALNRSPVYDTVYKGLPVIASIQEAYPEYEQDDPAVTLDVAAQNVEFEVKKNWADLCAVM